MNNGKLAEENKAIIQILSQKYPRFTKAQLSMVRNPEYGLQIAPEGISALREAGIPPPGKHRSRKVKLSSEGKSRKRLTIRFEKADYDMLVSSKKPEESMQSFIEKIIKEKLNG